jgi:hypothetical protein
MYLSIHTHTNFLVRVCEDFAVGLLSQYLHFCTSKSSKLSTATHVPVRALDRQRDMLQYLYICTSKASKLSNSRGPLVPLLPCAVTPPS